MYFNCIRVNFAKYSFGKHQAHDAFPSSVNKAVHVVWIIRHSQDSDCVTTSRKMSRFVPANRPLFLIAYMICCENIQVGVDSCFNPSGVAPARPRLCRLLSNHAPVTTPVKFRLVYAGETPKCITSYPQLPG